MGEDNVFIPICHALHKGRSASHNWKALGRQTPSGRQNHPDTVNLGIHSISDWYSSYWNAFLFEKHETMSDLEIIYLNLKVAYRLS